MTEASAIAAACVGGAAVCIAVMAPSGSTVPLVTVLPVLALLSALFVATLQFALYAFDLYDLRVAGEDRTRGARLTKAVGVTALVSAALLGAARLNAPPGALLGGALGAAVGSMLVRASLGRVVGRAQRVLLIGNGVKALSLTKLIEEQGDHLLTVCDRFEPPRQGTAAVAAQPLDEHAKKVRADYVVMACDEPRGTVGVDALIRCRVAGVRVYDAAGFCERVLRKIPVAHLRGSDLAYSDELTVSAVRRLAKRGFDLAMSALLFVLALPLMAFVAVAIKLDSKGPVFYRQERVGLNGKTYRLWKFRSMRTDAEKNGAVWAKVNDDRVTRVGRFIRKTRIDEIPQVFNVLMGDMSFVGPRPERPVFVEQLKEEIPFFSLREAVKPGITGWAQIRYPYGASVEDARNKLEYDLYYVKNGSLFLDFGIIFHTVRHVLLGRGAR
jgi:sugar transferase (PEP-CTERM system associated)